MTKEQIAFIAVVAILLAMTFLGGDSKSGPPLRSRPSGDATVPPALETSIHALPVGEASWSALGRNYFLAPRETQDLELRPLSPPPYPALPHPGLSLLLPLAPSLSAKLRHAIATDASAATAAPKRETVSTVPAPGEVPPEESLVVVDRSAVGMSLADRIRLTQQERIARDEADRQARMAEEERKKTLDKITWLNGQVAHGEVSVFEKKGPDRFAIKLELDRVRADTLLSEEDRRKRLEAHKLIFREDRGVGRPKGRSTITAAQLQSIEFAQTPLNQYGLRRHTIPADDLAAQEDLARFIADAGELLVAARHLEGMKSRGLFATSTAALLADVYRRSFRYDLELALLDEALATAKDDPGLLGRRGRLLIRLGLVDLAKESFEAALAKDPVYPLAHLGVGEVALEHGDAESALRSLRRIEGGTGLDRDQHSHALLLIGRAWLLTGDAATAESYFSRAQDRAPGNPRAFEGLVVTAYLARGAVQAASVLDRAQEANPADGRLMYLRGVCDLGLSRYGEARDHLQAAMDLDPLVTAEARAALSYLFEAGGAIESALGEVDLAVSANPLSLAAIWQRARLRLQVSDYEGARDALLTVLEREPGRADVLVALGDVAFRLGNPVDAARFYERAESMEPAFPGLLGRRIVTEVRRRRLADAEAMIKRIGLADEKNPFLEMAQAYYYYAKEKVEEAQRRFRLVIERVDPKPDPAIVAWAEETRASVEDNLNKEIWRDGFNRTGQILRGWKRAVARGVNAAIEDGRLSFQGSQRDISDEPTVLYQERPCRGFSSFVIDVDAAPQPGATMGIGLIAFNPSSKEPDPYPGLQRRDNRLIAFLGLQVALLPSGNLAYRTILQGKASEWQDIGGPEGTQSGPFSLGLEVEDIQKSTYRILVNQTPVKTGLEIPGLSRRPGMMEIQVFGQVQVDKAIKFSADNATLITLKKT